MGKKKIIAFGAHLDDIEVRCGGTVAKYAAEGWDVVYVVVIDAVYVKDGYRPPNGTYMELTHSDILKIRTDEITKSAKILGLPTPIFLHYKPSYYWTNKDKTSLRPHFTNTDADNAIIAGMKSYGDKPFILEAAHTPECVKEIENFILAQNAEIVLTQAPYDNHLEHYSTANLAFTACRNLKSKGHQIRLYSWEPGGAGTMIRITPDVIIDITNYFDKKMEAVKQFPSQMDEGLFEKQCLQSGATWGAKIGAKYGEPFVELSIDLKIVNGHAERDDGERLNQKKIRTSF